MAAFTFSPATLLTHMLSAAAQSLKRVQCSAYAATVMVGEVVICQQNGGMRASGQASVYTLQGDFGYRHDDEGRGIEHHEGQDRGPEGPAVEGSPPV
jgi:hypothetical protein